MGIVYLLQPYRYSKKNIYKIGMSRKNNLDRPNNYGSNTIIYLIMNCENSLQAENRIRKVFRKKFKNCLGYDYFQGDIHQMKKEFSKIVFELNEKSLKKKKNSKIHHTKTSNISNKKRKRSDSDDEDVEYVDLTTEEFQYLGNKSPFIHT